MILVAGHKVRDWGSVTLRDWEKASPLRDWEKALRGEIGKKRYVARLGKSVTRDEIGGKALRDDQNNGCGWKQLPLIIARSWFSKFSVFKTVSVLKKTQTRSFQLPPAWRALSFRDGLARMVSRLTVEIKLRFQISAALCRRNLTFHCEITQTEYHAEYVYYALVIIFELVYCFAFYQKATSIRHMVNNWNIQTNIWLKR